MHLFAPPAAVKTDCLQLVRDRDLADLITALEEAGDETLTLICALRPEKQKRIHAEACALRATLQRAVDYLCDLRERSP